jgi:hypothetical protein
MHVMLVATEQNEASRVYKRRLQFQRLMHAGSCTGYARETGDYKTIINLNTVFT